MQKLKIAVVEDDMIIADAISEMLVALGYDVTEPASRYSEAVETIETEKPDLLLLDINLVGQLDGIHLAELVRSKFNLPFIFLTANSDSDTIERAKAVKPSAYLVKPVTKEHLYSAIEIAFSNFNKGDVTAPVTETQKRDAVFVKDGYHFRKVYFNDIIYLESESNYVALHLNDEKKILVRNTLNDFLEQLDAKTFVRIHRSFAVNIKLVDGVYPTELSLKGNKIPLGKNYRDEVLKLLGIDNL